MNNTQCAYQHNPPIKSRNFINLNNLEQFKQNDTDGGFYQFKFEWIEREDEIPFFDFVSGNSSLEWKQRQHMLEAVNQKMNPFDIIAENKLNLTDVVFDGLSWSQDRNFHVMFDGIIHLGVEYLNGAGKQSRNLGWQPQWSKTTAIMPNQKFYSVGSLETKEYWFPLWLGGWISDTEVGNFIVKNGEAYTDGSVTEEDGGLRVMRAADYQTALFRSPRYTILKIKDNKCLS